MGRIILDKYNGEEKFYFKNGTISVHKSTDGWVSFVLEVDAECSADAMDLYDRTSTSVEAFVIVDKIDLALLKENTFLIPSGYDEYSYGWLSRIYYYEHGDLDKNKIEIKHIDSNRFTVKWSGETLDVESFDEKIPATKVLISGEFVFEDIDEWTSNL